MWTVVNAFAVCYHPVHNVWVQLNCADTAERSIAISYVPSLLSGDVLLTLGSLCRMCKLSDQLSFMC